MNFFADEGLDAPVVIALRQAGFNVSYAAELHQGASDEIILASARNQDCIQLTKDKDFGEMVIRNRQLTSGVVLIRINRLNDPEVVKRVVDVLIEYLNALYKNFTVIQEDKIRIRPLWL